MPSKKEADPVIHTRKTKLHKITQHVMTTTPALYLSRMERLRANGHYRETMFGYEICWNNYRYTFDGLKPKNKKEEKRRISRKKNLFIFALVARDAKKYIKGHKVLPTAWLPATNYNEKFKKKHAAIIGTDLDGAYWRIALQMGIISEKTYHHGMRIKDKDLCLAALANLGADKAYRIIQNGRMTDKIIVVKGSDILKEVYRRIRHACFDVMQTIAGMLRNDFVLYKTDCIFYVKSEKNILLVTTLLEDNELDYKMIDRSARSRLTRG